MANGANVIRDLFVRLGVQVDPKAKTDTERFDKGVKKVKKSLEDTAKVAVRVASTLLTVAASGVTLATGLAVATGRTAEEIERQAAALQLTRAEYQELVAVFDGVDAKSKDVADALGQLTDKAKDAAAGAQGVTDDFALVGLGIDQLRGKRPLELFETFADAVAGAEDRNAALAAVVRLLGDDLGRKLNPLLLQGAAGMRALRQEARDLGAVLTDEQLAAAKAVAVQWRQLTTRARSLRLEIGASLAPSVERLLRGLNDWIRANRQLISQRIERTFGAIDAVLTRINAAVQLVGGWDVIFVNVATGAGLLLLLANLGKVQALLSGLQVVVAFLGPILTAALAPLGLTLGGLVAILGSALAAVVLFGLAIDDLVVFLKGGESLLGRNLDRIEALIPAFGGLREVVSAVAERFAVAFRNVRRFVDAIVGGLAPALQLLEALLQPVREELDRLNQLWQLINTTVGAGLSGLASQIRGAASQADAAGVSRAADLEGRISGVVQGVVDRILNQSTVNTTTTNNGTVNQTNHFGSGGTEAADAMNAALRQAGLAVSGGPR